ncbi:hypothetical protein LPTSP3_g33380 [Leptospira kobayashii]|uniref:Uncharacterized protein n=1 Tax=Leptospira kobayashii TaxID=1917830 RepID=A0ABM7UTK6_9LEPT|nr:hypothetical protein LPTSP3_g33380 [Leptospira kobayashii]
MELRPEPVIAKLGSEIKKKIAKRENRKREKYLLLSNDFFFLGFVNMTGFHDSSRLGKNFKSV